MSFNKQVTMDIIQNGGEYLSCEMLQHGIRFDVNLLTHCCTNVIDPRTNTIMSTPLIINLNENTDINSLLSITGKSKLDYIYRFANCDLEKDIDFVCVNCQERKYQYWKGISENKFQLKSMIFAPHHTCNSRCYYCAQNHEAGKSIYDINRLISLFIENGNIDVNDIDMISWEGGEPALMPDFDNLFALLEQNVKFTNIPTSAIKYSELIAKRLNMSGFAQVLISIDAGTRDTYLKVKQVDQFDKVVENIKKYYEQTTNKSRIKIKYIVLPENCSFSEIDSFLDMIIKNDMKDAKIVISRNMYIPPSVEISLGIVYLHIQSVLRLGKPAVAWTDEIAGIDVHIQNINTIISQLVKKKELGDDSVNNELVSSLTKLNDILPSVNMVLEKFLDIQLILNSVLYEKTFTRKIAMRIFRFTDKNSKQGEIIDNIYRAFEVSYNFIVNLYQKIRN